MVDEIFLFIDLVDTGSFSKLSDKLDINQTTITRKIQTLEQQFGTLLIRTPQGVRTTVTGKNLYESFVDERKTFDRKLTLFNKKSTTTDSITILIPLWIAYHVVNVMIPKFTEENPDISLKIIYGDRDVDFIKENIDIAVVTGEQKQSFQIMKYLGQYKNIFYCRNDYIKIDQLPNTPAELRSHTFLGYCYDTKEHKIDATHQINIFSEADNKLVDTFSIDSNLTVSMYTGASQIMLNSNRYIALDYEFALTAKFATGQFLRVLPEFYAGTREYYITLPERKLSETKQKVYNFLVDAVTKEMTFKK